MPTSLLPRNLELQSLPAHEEYSGGVAGHAHNETAFRHLLEIERRRAERADQSVLLVLVKRVSPGHSGRIDAATATVIFAALGESVREADFVGWFRQNLVAGAVLIQPSGSSSDIRQLVTTRVTQALRGKQPQGRIRFRVLAASLSGKRKG